MEGFGLEVTVVPWDAAKPVKNQPVCRVCGGTGYGFQFSLFPTTPGFKFGEICADCDEKEE